MQKPQASFLVPFSDVSSAPWQLAYNDGAADFVEATGNNGEIKIKRGGTYWVELYQLITPTGTPWFANTTFWVNGSTTDTQDRYTKAYNNVWPASYAELVNIIDMGDERSTEVYRAPKTEVRMQLQQGDVFSVERDNFNNVDTSKLITEMRFTLIR